MFQVSRKTWQIYVLTFCTLEKSSRGSDREIIIGMLPDDNNLTERGNENL